MTTATRQRRPDAAAPFFCAAVAAGPADVPDAVEPTAAAADAAGATDVPDTVEPTAGPDDAGPTAAAPDAAGPTTVPDAAVPPDAAGSAPDAAGTTADPRRRRHPPRQKGRRGSSCRGGVLHGSQNSAFQEPSKCPPPAYRRSVGHGASRWFHSSNGQGSAGSGTLL